MGVRQWWKTLIKGEPLPEGVVLPQRTEEEQGSIDSESGYEQEGSNETNNPRSRRQHMRVETARDFFGAEIEARYDDIEPAIQEMVKGSYRVELKGQSGGIWTFALGDNVQVENARKEADVVLSGFAAEFVGIVNGDINPQVALMAQKFKITGSVRKALAVQFLLSPSRD